MIKERLIALLAVCSVTVGVAAAAGFDDHFEDATLRVDFFQYGDAETEHAAIDRLIRQGPWAGPLDRLIDPHPYGRYVVRVIAPADGRVVFERGFDSYFGEYRTTEPAALGVPRVYHETVLLPFPRHPVQVSLGVRSPGDGEPLLIEVTVDPAGSDIAAEPPAPGATVVEGHIAGDPHDSLDIAIVGEGYAAGEVQVFGADLARFSTLLLGQQPYASFREKINIRGVVLPSHDSGVDEPTKNSWRSTAVGAGFNALGSPRYLLTESNRDLRDIAANVSYDTLVIMVNHDRYGGGGIYNKFCTFTAHGPFAGYLLLHEFGHSFGGLADEYYTSSTAYTDFYPHGAEPLQPNITALLDPESVKWADLVTPATELPTPWEKELFDVQDLKYQEERRKLNGEIAEAARSGASAAELKRLQDAEDQHALGRAEAVDEFMEASDLTAAVGAFEGAGYVSEGMFRPAIDCLMFTRGVKPLCPVCRRAVASRIRAFTDE